MAAAWPWSMSAGFPSTFAQALLPWSALPDPAGRAAKSMDAASEARTRPLRNCFLSRAKRPPVGVLKPLSMVVSSLWESGGTPTCWMDAGIARIRAHLYRETQYCQGLFAVAGKSGLGPRSGVGAPKRALRNTHGVE